MGAPGTSSGPWTVEDRGTRDRTFRIRCADGTQNGGAGMVVVERVELDHDAHQIAASGVVYDALERSQRILRSFIGTGTVGGSCSLCGSMWETGAEKHAPGCLIATNAAALAKARGES
jgi:hypothetical protein